MQNHMHENMIACGLRDLEIEKQILMLPQVNKDTSIQDSIVQRIQNWK